MKKFIFAALSALSPVMASADLSHAESEDLLQCAQQFGLIQESEIGEATGLNEKHIESTDEGTIRIYELVYGNESRGLLQIDVQGDISQVDKTGNILNICQ